MSLAQRLVMEAVQLGIAVLKGGDPATQRSLYNKLQTADMIVVCFKVFHDQQRKSGPLLLQTSRPNYWPKYWPCCPSSASSSSSGRTTTATCRISFAPSQTRAATTSCQRKLILLDCICGRQRLGLYINERNVALINQTLEMFTVCCLSREPELHRPPTNPTGWTLSRPFC